MDKFGYMEQFGYEQLTFFHDKGTGLKALTCIHNTVLGPSLGGTRVWNYDNEEDAVLDVLRLARGMTYKSSLAGLDLGGGKSVIIGDAEELKKDPTRSEAFWRAFGRYVEGLNGRYITAADVGTTPQVLAHVKKETNHVVGLAGRSGDPSPFTARGVYRSILACCQFLYGDDSIEGKTVAVQGTGKVGYYLCEYLHKAGAKLIVSDVNKASLDSAAKEFGATIVAPDAIYGVECDIFAPCALGAVINDETVPQLKCNIVCGGSNNVLKNAAVHNKALADKGITYAPDYLANAGGVINVSYELKPGGYDKEASTRDVDYIYYRMLDVLNQAKAANELAYLTADRIAEARIAAVKDIKTILTSN